MRRNRAYVVLLVVALAPLVAWILARDRSAVRTELAGQGSRADGAAPPARESEAGLAPDLRPAAPTAAVSPPAADSPSRLRVFVDLPMDPAPPGSEVVVTVKEPIEAADPNVPGLSKGETLARVPVVRRGRLELPELAAPPGTRVRVFADVPGLVVAEETVVLPAEEVVLLRVAEVARRGRTVRGRVVDAYGRPLPGLRGKVVTKGDVGDSHERLAWFEWGAGLGSSRDDFRDDAFVTTDEDGRFEGLGFGQVGTRFLLADPAWFIRPSPPERPDSGERTWIAVPGFEIRLRIEDRAESKDSEGEDAEGMTWRIDTGLQVIGTMPDGESWRSRIPSDVVLRTALPSPGATIRLAVSRPGVAPKLVSVAGPRGAAATTLDVVLDHRVESSGIRVTPTGAEAGLAAGMRLRLRDPSTGTVVEDLDLLGWERSLDAVVPCGTYDYELRLGLDLFGLLTRQGKITTSRDEITALEFRPSPCGTLRVEDAPRALDSLARTLVVWSPDGRERRAPLGDEALLPVGRWSVFLEHGIGRRALGDVEIKEGREETLRLGR